MVVSVNQILSLFNEGKYKEARNLLPEIDTPSSVFFEAVIHNFFGNFNKALEALEKVNVEELTPNHELYYHSALAETFYRRYEFDKMSKCCRIAKDRIREDISKDQEQLFWESNVFLYEGYYTGLMGHYKESIESLTQYMNYARQLGYPTFIARAYNVIGESFTDMRDYEKGLELLELGYNKVKEIPGSVSRAAILTNIGNVYEKRGDLRKAEKYYKDSIEAYQLTEYPGNGYLPELKLGDLNLNKGELESAEIVFTNILYTGVDRGYKIQESLALFSLALVCKRKGEFQRALDFLERTYVIQTKLDSAINISDTLIEIIKVTGYLKLKDKLLEYLEKLKELSDQEGNPIIETRYRLARGLMLKSESRLKDKLESQKIFQDIAYDPALEELDIKNQALINLCELLLFEIRSSHDSSLLGEIYTYLDQIQDHSVINRSVIIKLEIQFLRAKFLIAENRVVEGIELLNNVYNETEEIGLEEIRERASSELQKIRSEVEMIQNMNSKNVMEEEKMKSIEEYLTELGRLLR